MYTDSYEHTWIHLYIGVFSFCYICREHTCNLNTMDTEAKGLQVQDQPGLHTRTLFSMKSKNKNKKTKFTSIKI